MIDIDKLPLEFKFGYTDYERTLIWLQFTDYSTIIETFRYNYNRAIAANSDLKPFVQGKKLPRSD